MKHDFPKTLSVVMQGGSFFAEKVDTSCLSLDAPARQVAEYKLVSVRSLKKIAMVVEDVK